jgi:DNA (cytosine-5)-methyltransferase 1
MRSFHTGLSIETKTLTAYVQNLTMTYKPRVIRKPKGALVNGSAAILILKDGQPPLSQVEMSYFATDEYRKFYRIARNYQTRSLNVDANSVFFFGRLVEETKYKLA